jgi:predicted Zn finger-like uncharacterized protein
MVSNSLTDRRYRPAAKGEARADSPMLIVCPSCSTSYDVTPASLAPSGRQVRCVRCRAVWHAEPAHADKVLLAAADIAPGTEHSAAAAAVPPEAGDTADGWAQSDALAGEQSHGGPLSSDMTEQGEGFEASTAEAGGSGTPPIAPSDGEASFHSFDDDGPVDQHEMPAEDIESVAARRQRRGGKRSPASWPLSRLHSAVLALALLDIFVIGWRGDIVRAMPQTASFYGLLGLPVNLRGLTFDDVVTKTEQHEGVPILVVEGNVFNGGHKTQDVPRLKFVVRNAARQEIYSWTAVPSHASLAAGEAVAFRTRLASPPSDAHDLILRFVNRHDIVSGTH